MNAKNMNYKFLSSGTLVLLFSCLFMVDLAKASSVKDFNKCDTLTLESKCIAQNNTEYVETLSKRIDESFKTGDFARAINFLDEMIEINPENEVAYALKGLAYYNLRQYSEAIENYNQSINLNPSEAQIYIWRGNALYDIGNKQRAIKDYNQAILLEPVSWVAYVERANTRDDLGDRKGALQDYSKAIEINPTDPQIYVNRAVTYGRLGDRNKKIADLVKAAQLYKKQGDEENYRSCINQLDDMGVNIQGF